MILVTGATGNIGSQVIQQLSALGVQVRSLIHNPKKAENIKLPGVEIAIGDFEHPHTLDAALKNVKTALLIPVNNFNQVEHESNFIAAAKRAGTEYIVKISSALPDVDSPSIVTSSHAKTEKILESSGLAFTILQPNFFMQNFFWFTSTIQKGILPLPLKNAKAAMIDVRDIAAVAVAVLTQAGHEGKTYKLTGSEALTPQDVAEKLSLATGRKISHVYLSPEDFAINLLAAGQPQWAVDSAIYDWQNKLEKGFYAPITNVVTEIAKKQPISFDEFASDHVHLFTKVK